MKNIIKYVKLILSIIVFSISSTFSLFAGVEVEPSIDIYNSYEGWYKNFIVDCGACRITVRNYDGSTLYDYVVYPKQFQNNSEIIRALNYAGVDNQKDSEGRTVFFMQKNEGRLNLNDYDYKGLEKKYSDNIPQLANLYTSNKREFPHIYFEEFSKYTTVDGWKGYNNGENVNKLATDLGIDVVSLCKNPVDGKELSFYNWLTTANAEGISPSLEVQPLTLYPETTEQIYCNDLNTASKFGMQWNSDMGKYCAELAKNSGGIFEAIGNFFDGIFMKIFGGKKIGIGDLITFYNGKLVYYDVGVMVTEIKEQVDIERGTGKTYTDKKYYGVEPNDINPVEFEKMFPNKDMSNFDFNALSDDELSILLWPSVKKSKYGDNPLRIPSEISREIVEVTEILTPKYVILTYTETTQYSHPWETKGAWANYQKIPINTYTLEEMLFRYYGYNVITIGENYSPSEDDNISQSYVQKLQSLEQAFINLSNKTESNTESLLKSKDRYYMSFEEYYTLQGYKREGNTFKSLAGKGIGDTTTIKTDHNKYVTIIENDATKQKTLDIVKTQSSFNCSNLPKYGAGIICGSGDIIATQSQILLIFNNNLEQIGGDSSIDEQYNTMVSIGEMFKASKTYPDEIAEDYKTSDGSAYTYTSYTAIPGKDGNSGSGRRFKIGKSREITEELLSYALDKQKDESGNEYSVVVLYVDWCYNEEDEGLSKSMILYEDELSNVYDFNSIDSTGNTRKLQGVINRGGKQHPVDGLGGCGGHTCSHKTDGTFDISIYHDFSGGDYNNCILDEQQVTVGDGTYTKSGQEQETLQFLDGSELNHTFVGYRDKEKDLRIAYKDSSKNSSEANTAIPKFSINYDYKRSSSEKKFFIIMIAR